MVYSCDPLPLIRVGHGQTQVHSLEEMLKEREDILDDLKYHLIKAQQRMKRAADCKRREEVFEVGEQVYLKLQPYR